jgi:Holliday junction resolvase RusA-like endonuclease
MSDVTLPRGYGPLPSNHPFKLGSVAFSLSGEPNGKGRPRISTRNGMVRAYTPEKTRNYSAALRMAAQTAMEGRKPFEGPVKVIVFAMFGVPASFSKKKRERALDDLNLTMYPTKKPDIDNIAKHFDALNGIVWTDDKNVVSCHIYKRYDECPELQIIVEEV